MLRKDLACELEDLYSTRGTRRYGLEAISQLQHALQTATLAEAQRHPPAMVLAALLHDVGHLITGLGENPAEAGVDDRHELAGADWLRSRLGEGVSEPVRLHVAAKRYLCATDPAYATTLAGDSVLSLELQGGPMQSDEIAKFLAEPCAQDAILLRRLDEQAKDPEMQTPPFAHFLRELGAAEIGSKQRAAFERASVLVLRNFFSTDEVAELERFAGAMGTDATNQLERATRLGMSPARMAQSEPRGLIVVPEAGNPGQVCRFEYLLGANESFRAFVRLRIGPVIDALARERFLPFKDKENEKHPGGGAFGAHQDYAAYQAFGPRYNITAMISVDKATRANGCLEFAEGWIEGAHASPKSVEKWIDGRALLRFHKGGTNNGDIVDTIANELAWRAVETDTSDLVIFDSFVPHRSASNESGTPRRAMFLTFNAEREGNWYERYYRDKRENFDDPKFHVSTPTTHG